MNGSDATQQPTAEVPAWINDETGYFLIINAPNGNQSDNFLLTDQDVVKANVPLSWLISRGVLLTMAAIGILSNSILLGAMFSKMYKMQTSVDVYFLILAMSHIGYCLFVIILTGLQFDYQLNPMKYWVPNVAFACSVFYFETIQV